MILGVDNTEVIRIEASNNIVKSSRPIGIGTSPDNSAILDLNSNSKGFLPPRMTGLDASNNLTSPAEGLMVYITDSSTSPFTSKGWWGYNGTNWIKIG